ncbi:hypothetical protein ARMGADRAFT_1090512 [Armillaria gallica]|uniref:Uncharacterized protein n=1 Tax=Armillaria gallica TaxID=47427 RepID=A0A2H3D472_ARMGA|nr:hypothetical protein ARMGADRAFT_1090512 [Armillaria gallica]
MEESADNQWLDAEKQKLKEEQKLDRKWHLTAKRVRNFWARQKEEGDKDSDGSDALNMLMLGTEAQASQSKLPGDVSATDVSRLGKEKWCKYCNGTQGGMVVQSKAQ